MEITGQIFQLSGCGSSNKPHPSWRATQPFYPNSQQNTTKHDTRNVPHIQPTVTLALREERLPGGSQSTLCKRQPDVCVHSTEFYWLGCVTDGLANSGKGCAETEIRAIKTNDMLFWHGRLCSVQWHMMNSHLQSFSADAI